VRSARVTLLALLVAGSFPTRARAADADPAAEPAAAGGQDDAQGETEAAAPAAASSPAPRIPIAGYELAGQRIDGDNKVLDLLVSVAPSASRSSNRRPAI
jgi:hypothetical protein